MRLENVHAGFGKSGIEGIETVLSPHEQLLLLRRLAPLFVVISFRNLYFNLLLPIHLPHLCVSHDSHTTLLWR